MTVVMVSYLTSVVSDRLLDDELVFDHGDM